MTRDTHMCAPSAGSSNYLAHREIKIMRQTTSGYKKTLKIIKGLWNASGGDIAQWGGVETQREMWDGWECKFLLSMCASSSDKFKAPTRASKSSCLNSPFCWQSRLLLRHVQAWDLLWHSPFPIDDISICANDNFWILNLILVKATMIE